MSPAGRVHPVSGFCDHCGQPLSDPYSLLVGVGPVCRGYYEHGVIRGVALASEAPRSKSGIYPGAEEAVKQLRLAWGDLSETKRD